MSGEDLILRYHELVGRPVTIDGLKNIHAQVQGYLDSIGSGPYVPQLKQIRERVVANIKRIQDEDDGNTEFVVESIAPFTPERTKPDHGPKIIKALGELTKIVKTKKAKETPKQKEKIAKVLHEFKAKKLKTPQGKVVKKKKQSVAIALREAKMPKRKFTGMEFLNKLRHYLDGYLSLEQDKEKLIKALESFNGFYDNKSLKEREKYVKLIEDKESALQIQVERGAKELGISEQEFIGRLNDYSENKKSLKNQIEGLSKKRVAKLSGIGENKRLQQNSEQVPPTEVKPPAEPTPTPPFEGLGFVTADKAPDKPVNTFRLSGPIGELLGDIQAYKYEIVSSGETHSSKSQLAMQMADAFAEKFDEVAYLDWEHGGLQSKDTINMIERNVKPENKKKIHVSGNVPRTLEAIKSLAKKFKVIILDSGTKLNQVTNAWIDTLREEHPDTIWIIIMQQNEKGGTRGGSSAEFDAPVVIKTYHPDPTTHEKNYAVVTKNRGNKTGVFYSINEKKIIPDPNLKVETEKQIVTNEQPKAA